MARFFNIFNGKVRLFSTPGMKVDAVRVVSSLTPSSPVRDIRLQQVDAESSPSSPVRELRLHQDFSFNMKEIKSKLLHYYSEEELECLDSFSDIDTKISTIISLVGNVFNEVLQINKYGFINSFFIQEKTKFLRTTRSIDNLLVKGPGGKRLEDFSDKEKIEFSK